MQNWRTVVRKLKRRIDRIVKRIRSYRYKFWITPRSQITAVDIALLKDVNRPVFFHCPTGQPENGMTSTVKKHFESVGDFVLHNHVTTNTLTPDTNIAFVTYSNYSHLTLVEKCYRKYGIQPFVLGKSVSNWSWLQKIILVRELMDELPVAMEYIVATDASDVIVVNDPALIIERFNQLDCDMLFCNTVADWPPNPDLAHFEANCYPTAPHHCHLSAGAYVARRSKLNLYLDAILDASKTQMEWTLHAGKFDDQASWRHLHRQHYPKIKVDHNSSVFCRFDIYRDQR